MYILSLRTEPATAPGARPTLFGARLTDLGKNNFGPGVDFFCHLRARYSCKNVNFVLYTSNNEQI